MEPLLANLQHRFHATIVSSRNQILDNICTENIDLVSPGVDDSFKSVIEITESTECSNEDLKTDKKITGNNAYSNNIVSKNINDKSTNEISKESQNCDSSRASIQE